jgi:hypothetical protein
MLQPQAWRGCRHAATAFSIGCPPGAELSVQLLDAGVGSCCTRAKAAWNRSLYENLCRSKVASQSSFISAYMRRGARPVRTAASTHPHGVRSVRRIRRGSSVRSPRGARRRREQDSAAAVVGMLPLMATSRLLPVDWASSSRIRWRRQRLGFFLRRRRLRFFLVAPPFSSLLRWNIYTSGGACHRSWAIRRIWMRRRPDPGCFGLSQISRVGGVPWIFHEPIQDTAAACFCA